MTKQLALALLLTALLAAACGAQPTPTAAPPAVVVDDFAVVADGRVTPAQSLALSFAAGGKLAEIFFAEGDSVAAGDLIAQLENSAALRAQVASAELELLSAEQALADLHDAAAMIAAQAAYDRVQAQDALTRAEKDLRSIQNPVSERLVDAVDDAQLALETAQANLQLSNVSPEVQAYEQAVVAADLAFRAYQNLQAEYDKSNGNLELLDAVKVAQANYQSALDAQLALELQINTARANQAAAAGEAQEAYDDAVANLEAARRGPNADRLALAEAQAALAQAALAEAERHHARVQSGPDSDQVALAEARIAAARAGLAAAQSALENAELRAPFAGTLARLDLKVGEQVAPAQPVGTLADFSSWWVETDNLTEIEVVRIREGQGASIVLDALPDTPLTGTVTAIDTVFEEKRGDITYTARIALADVDPLMRWGMTAAVTFDK
jgi:multidrug resistance efflux pump